VISGLCSVVWRWLYPPGRPGTVNSLRVGLQRTPGLLFPITTPLSYLPPTLIPPFVLSIFLAFSRRLLLYFRAILHLPYFQVRQCSFLFYTHSRRIFWFFFFTFQTSLTINVFLSVDFCPPHRKKQTKELSLGLFFLAFFYFVGPQEG